MQTEKVDPARYDTRLDVKYGHGAIVDVAAEIAEHEPWFNQTLTRVNDSVVRLGILRGEYHWHKHAREDEFFLVLDGELVIDLDGAESVTLGRRQGYTVSAGTIHRTRAAEKTVVIMVEAATVTPTGDD